MAVDDDGLEPRLAALEAAGSWSPRAVSQLEGRIRGGDDAELFRVNPRRARLAQPTTRPGC